MITSRFTSIMGRTRGFSLVELMVAMTIGLIILAAIAKLFTTSRSTYTLEEGLARVQESGRFGMEFISTDVRMAGYTGCLSKSTTVTNNLVNPSAYATNYSLGNYLTGHTYTGSGTALTDWTPSLPATGFSAGEVEPGTDVLVIRRGSEIGVKLGSQMTPDTSASVNISGNPGALKQFDIVLISDCKSADIFQISGPASISNGGDNLVHNTGVGSPGNLVTPLSKQYDTDAELLKLITRVYYISRRGNIATNPPALFRKELSVGSLSAQELVEGVENMKILYGIDLDNDRVANKYLAADAVGTTEWPLVVSARVGLLVSTLEKVTAHTELTTFNLVGTNISVADSKKRHRSFNSTIQLRN